MSGIFAAMKYLYLIIIAPLCLAISCKKDDATVSAKSTASTRHIKYETRCASNICRIEYTDAVNKKNVLIDSVPGNFVYEFDLPITQKIGVGYLNIAVDDIAKSAQGATAMLYINDTIIDTNGSLYHGNASNRKSY